MLTGREHGGSPFFAHDKFTVQLPVGGHTGRNVSARDGEESDRILKVIQTKEEEEDEEQKGETDIKV